MSRRKDLRDYMPFRGERFFAGTRLWDWSEVGVYVWAIWQQWSSGRRQVISDQVYQDLPERPRTKFKQVRGGWRNKQCFDEYRDALGKYEEASRRNAANAQKRWDKRDATGMRPHSETMRTDAYTKPNQTKPNHTKPTERVRAEREGLRLIEQLAAKTGEDPSEVLATAARFRDGPVPLNLASMKSDTWLATTVDRLRQRLGELQEERPDPGKVRAVALDLRRRAGSEGPVEEFLEEAERVIAENRQ